MTRRIIIIVVTAVVLIGGGSYGWQYLANQITARVNQQVDRLASQGKNLECANQRVEGYPFRVGLFCDDITYDDKSGKVFFKAGEVRSAAQFYQPGFIIGELDGPAELKTPGLSDLKLNWKLARSSSRIGIDGVKRISLLIDELEISGASGLLKDTPIASLGKLELHVRPAGDDTNSSDVEAAINGSGVRFINASKERLSPLDIKLDGVIPGINRAIRQGKDLGRWLRINGLRIQVHKFEISTDNGAKLTASGPLKIARDGLLEGRLDVEVEGFQKLVENFTAQNPQLGETAQSIKTAALIFTDGNSDGIVRMKIQIARGAITMGFFPLGYIPKLW